MAIPRPDLSKRPFGLIIERQMTAAPSVLFRAWTQELDRWFATPGTLLMQARVDTPYFFETYFEGKRHPHHGRILQLETNKLFEITWLNEDGTLGAETILKLEFETSGDGTLLRLSHDGLPSQDISEGHKQAWQEGLNILEKTYPGK